MALPAHQTKHLPMLTYPFFDNTFELSQSNDGHVNGTALWLGAQCLSAFLADVLPSPQTKSFHRTTNSSASVLQGQGVRKLRAIELGSGIGLSALALAALGWDVLATDTPAVIDAVLASNVARNMQEEILVGTVQVRALDWTVPPAEWDWDDPACVADPRSDSAKRRGSDFGSTIDKGTADDADELLRPPFDLILTADTVYSPALISPLLRTLRHLCLLSLGATNSSSKSPSSSVNPSEKSAKLKHPHLYLALEARDPVLVSSFFAEVRNTWGLAATQVPQRRVVRGMARVGLSGWARSDWEGVQIWKMQLIDTGTVQSAGKSYGMA
ncbi:hypothetical protein DFH11DRAFT_1839761 [Phellopilus nigrolimitatus]|nr:hypothetical protein DFH11DRAFT_1839761 [Phellopilus nigrolimitatus]